MIAPLADRIRPQTIDEVVGQHHIIGEGKLLSNIIGGRDIPNMIFFGPSGTGKTTVANICAKVSDKTLYKLNATNASTKDIKEIADNLDSFQNRGGVLLYLDEIQNFNKKQQQSLLEYIENGRITLIASTTENPYFYVYNAILSRCTVIEFKPIDEEDIERAVRRGVEMICADYPDKSITFDEDAIRHISYAAFGDVRKSLNSVEMCVKSRLYVDGGDIRITLQIAQEATQKSAFFFDKDGDSHYDVVSAFQKSIRGSDPDAAVHYLARLIEGGDLPSVCRRLMVTAAEDIGLAYPQAISITKSCVDAALQLGLPEARIPLADAVIMLACLPKSNAGICAIDDALADIRSGRAGSVPDHLKDAHYSGAKKLGHGTEYKYPHAYPNHYVPQQYLPDTLKDKVYYHPGNNKTEDSFRAYQEHLKGKTKE
ncbi:MAG: replication-associated recombination protein A [Ruminococcaceae bacterium]|nr:replication-associated recombination protein A [Oscillospiraceae bacterium]